MNLLNNIQNGGLICRDESTLIVGQVIRGRGMSYLQVIGDFTQEEIMPWFMNKADEAIYYSNALAQNFLYKVDINTRLHECVLKEPVYLLQYEDFKLYFINENSRALHSYSLREKELKKLIAEEVITFNVSNDRLWYSTEKGLFCCSKDGSGKEKLGNSQAVRIICDDRALVFIDKSKVHQVGMMNLSQGETDYIPKSAATSINKEGSYLFYNHAGDKGHLYRYDEENGFDIKFIPERADYLHIEDKMLYYFNLDEKIWKKVATQGGRPVPLGI